MVERIEVGASGELLAVLVGRLPGWRRNTLKERLHAGRIQVNGRVVRRHDHALVAGDSVTIDAGPATAESTPAELGGLPLLHLDERLVAIDKPAGLLSVSTDRQSQRTALAMVRQALSRPGRPQSLWPVHRLDRETSGVLLMARDKAACDQLQDDWGACTKVYVAIVEGHPSSPSGTIDQPLFEDRDLRVHVGHGPTAKSARTHYTTLERGRHQSLLEVTLETGRRHQIRVHLAWLGHPIVGDDRYGTSGGRLMLHARQLSVPALGGRGQLELSAPLPRGLVLTR